MKSLIAFPHLKPSDVGRAGRKACNLAFLSRSGFDVPTGAVIPVQEYDRALKASAMISSAQSLPANALRKVCADIGRHFEAFPLSCDLRREIDLFMSGSGGRWIARSSSTDEDGSVYSYAGIFNSIADNIDSSQVLKAVQEVWKSFWSEEAFLYRELRHRPHFGSGMAVIIQRQIDAFVSGVVFTRHPVTDENILVINAHRGAGEELVQGRTTPFSMEIEKGKPGEPAVTAISSEGEAPLDKEAFLELAALAIRMEQLFRYPLDIEWVYNQKFFFVQARPLTGRSMEWTTDPVSEFMGERLTALSADLFREYMERHFTAFYRDLAVISMSGRVFDVFNGVIYARKDVLKTIETGMADEKIKEGMSVRIGQMMEKLPLSVEQYRREIEALQAMSLADLTPARAWELLQRVWKLFCHSDPVVKMTYLLGNLLRYFDSFDEGERFKELFTDHTSLEGQSDAERFHDELITLMEENSSDGEFLRWLENSGALPEPHSIRGFIKSQGSWSASPFELEKKRLGEESAQLCIFLRALQKREGRELFINIQATQKKRRYEAQQELLNLRNKYIAPDEKGGLKACVEWIMYLQEERERHRKYTYMVTALLRKLFLIIGADLESRGFMSGEQGKEDIFHLTLEEIERIRNLSEHVSDWSDHISFKKALWEKERDDVFPCEFSGFSPKPVMPQHLPGSSGVTATGQTLSRGSAAGTARVIESGGTCEAISAGDILVVQNCEPYWALYFPLISGLIAECGGMLSHAAILAREYQIPAVSGIAAATKIIKSGDFVAIDADKGTVTIQR